MYKEVQFTMFVVYYGVILLLLMFREKNVFFKFKKSVNIIIHRIEEVSP
jgi:hypothetical protein